MKWTEVDTLPCSVARSLAVVGDRWTLLILRGAFLRTRRFDEFQQQIGLTRHRLADRLARLVRLGVLEKQPYQERPLRHEYRLTEKGRDLYPLLMALVAWGDKWLDEGRGPPLLYKHRNCGHTFHAMTVCSECREPIDPRDVTPLAGPGLRAPNKPASGGSGRRTKT